MASRQLDQAARRMSAAALVVALLAFAAGTATAQWSGAAAAAAAAAAGSKPDTPAVTGCWIAESTQPRVCTYVEPRCGPPAEGTPLALAAKKLSSALREAKRAAAAAASAVELDAAAAADGGADAADSGSGGSRRRRLLQEAAEAAAARARQVDRAMRAAQASAADNDADCDVCERRSFTYLSRADCEAAGARVARATADARLAGVVAPAAAAAAAAYPSVAPTREQMRAAITSASTTATRRAGGPLAAAACPPTQTGTACTAFTAANGWVEWQTLFPSATTNATTDVTLPAGSKVVIWGCKQASSRVRARKITVPAGATLAVGDSPLSLFFTNLDVSGTFQMGTASCPIRSLITVNVAGGVAANGIDARAGSKYDVHGHFVGVTWTRLAASVAPGQRTVSLQAAVNWAAGDKVVLVSTAWKDEINNQNEVLTIANVSTARTAVTFTTAAQFFHYGGAEYQAELGKLNRRITFTSDATSTSTLLGPHQTFFTPDARISGVAIQKWGAQNEAGKYPIHWHLAGDTTNAWAKNNAISASNWRCCTVHGTNAVTVSGNVCFNVFGHGFYLEDGVEERNVISKNLAANIHPIQMAGSGGGQQGTDRWQGPGLFDPTDAGAAGFYSLNLYNTWTDNAAAGGFAGFSFPQAPRPIKDSRYTTRKDGSGLPFVPSFRPFVSFARNTAHSTGWQWEHGGAVYFGGVLCYNKDWRGAPEGDGQVKLYYNNGRGSFYCSELCPDVSVPASSNYYDWWRWRWCSVNSARDTANAADDLDSEGFLVLRNTTAALANVGIASWGHRIEVKGFNGYDLSRGGEFLGQSWLTNAVIKINTSNVAGGTTGWPFDPRIGERFWESYVIKGFEWYDTTTSTLLSNVRFENYKFYPNIYPTDPNDWWSAQTPMAVRMLSHSDQFKPDKVMAASKGITCANCDFGLPGCVGLASTCGGAFYRVDQKFTSSSWLFSWYDADGSVVKMLQPSKPSGAYLIGSQPSWWNLYPGSSWQEAKIGNAWVSPAPPAGGAVEARLEMRIGERVALSDGSIDRSKVFTVHAFEDSQIVQRIGNAYLYGSDLSRGVTISRTEGTTGMTAPFGWYAVFTLDNGATFLAPKRLELVLFNVPRTKAVLYTTCFPPGATISVSKSYDGSSSCQARGPMVRKASRNDLLAGTGHGFWVDGSNCLHLKVTDAGEPWRYTDSFERDGLYIEEEVRWYDLRYIITATGMGCSDAFFCPLPGDPAARVPSAVATMPAQTCSDVAPSGSICGGVRCGWYSGGCSSTTIVNGGYCKDSCAVCS